MTELLTAAQMRAIEQAAIESGEVTGLELMERAGRGVVEAIFEQWPELGSYASERGASPSRSPGYLEPDENDPLRAVVLCGPGNNGGDGFVVARLLKEHGWEVAVFLYGDAGTLPPDAKVNCERWERLGDVHLFEDFQPPHGAPASLYVDALFGTGLSRPLGALYRELCGAAGAETGPPRWVAVDVASGVCADSGFVLRETAEQGRPSSPPDPAIEADLTVTFHRAKLGHYLAAGASSCGKIVVKDIGLSSGDERKGVVELTTPILCGKNGASHKYTHGHALVLSGGHGNTGAARMAARGALRIGAGLVTLGSPRSAMFENAVNLTAVMVRQIDGAPGLAELLEDARYNALCVGPGMGIRADTQALVLAVLKERRPTVLDADALTRFSVKPAVLFDMLHEDCVITPHGGEFARLFPDIAERLDAPATAGPAYSKVDATREAAKRAGCVVLFKGPDTVIAAPDGRCSINSAQYQRSAPWLATAGSGDVLAGFITGMMARGFAPMQAAETAAWLHVECARKFGPGLIAEDLAEQLPAVFRDLGL
ncbi:NAD(P)H-hydrate dehydratase [Parasedimentitalea psychrophila]|uniref:Bifunctional NAD(P)H-hydrate repair enzyme n=1 Tax=Parasedimentitalea psychrophila TaxID=2997337 RepID=A0A9Y2KVV1_9RHOB|nr:NAD(P)H-hydrate dehydratase [Parasedimentitalea psychrophila]WIY23623.1 NAD(P)H-hydrate dehydratase [Parasedimentitalea psychrophila]